MTRTIKAAGFRWQVQVRPARDGFSGFYRDDSLGHWGSWRRVFPGGGSTWPDAKAALAALITFVS